MSTVLPLAGRSAALRRLTRHLLGSGLELGPGHNPLADLHEGTQVRYVDRWSPEQNRELFPELGGDAPFPRPDVVADLDRDRLSAVEDASQDFVIASHVLEHVAEPIGLLAEVHRVLRPGGVALVLLPDRRRTFDRNRTPTPLAHLVAEHEAGVDAVDDAHVLDFLRGVGEPVDTLPPEELRAVVEVHRGRSVHVHVWAETDFPPVVEHCVAELGHAWELVDVLNNDDYPDSIEFGLVLRRATGDVDPGVRAARFRSALAVLGPQPDARPGAVSAPGDPVPPVRESGDERDVEVLRHRLSDTAEQLRLARQDADNWQAAARAHRQRLDALAASPLGPVLRAAWALRTRSRPHAAARP